MPSREENLARYERLVPHLHHVQTTCWNMVNEEMMRAACRVMAVATGCRFMPREQDSIVLMLNYCCFNVFSQDGRGLLDFYAEQHPPQDDDRRAVLQAHRRSFFSVFEVVRLEPGLGVGMRDLFTDETVLVVCPRLAEGLRAGLAVPVRVMPLEDFHVLFNGPIPHIAVPSIEGYAQQLFEAYVKFGFQKGQPLSEELRGKIETFQTIDTLAHRYPELKPPRKGQSADAPQPAARRFAPLPPTGSVGRNDPCPCGSGKKFKNCCLQRN